MSLSDVCVSRYFIYYPLAPGDPTISLTPKCTGCSGAACTIGAVGLLSITPYVRVGANETFYNGPECSASHFKFFILRQRRGGEAGFFEPGVQS